MLQIYADTFRIATFGAIVVPAARGGLCWRRRRRELAPVVVTGDPWDPVREVWS